MAEKINIIDKKGKVIGVEERKTAIKKRLLHRIIGIMIFDSSEKLLIQKRSKKMDLYPDYWTLSVTGHVLAGEEPMVAAVREAREELGIDVKKNHLIKLTEFIVNTPEEYALATIYYYEYNTKPVIDREEVQAVKKLPISAALKLKLTPAAEKAVHYYIDEIL